MARRASPSGFRIVEVGKHHRRQLERLDPLEVDGSTATRAGPDRTTQPASRSFAHGSASSVRVPGEVRRETATAAVRGKPDQAGNGVAGSIRRIASSASDKENRPA